MQLNLLITLGDKTGSQVRCRSGHGVSYPCAMCLVILCRILGTFLHVLDVCVLLCFNILQSNMCREVRSWEWGSKWLVYEKLGKVTERLVTTAYVSILQMNATQYKSDHMKPLVGCRSMIALACIYFWAQIWCFLQVLSYPNLSHTVKYYTLDQLSFCSKQIYFVIYSFLLREKRKESKARVLNRSRVLRGSRGVLRGIICSLAALQWKSVWGKPTLQSYFLIWRDRWVWKVMTVCNSLG